LEDAAGAGEDVLSADTFATMAGQTAATEVAPTA
jgi:hypothetical protein